MNNKEYLTFIEASKTGDLDAIKKLYHENIDVTTDEIADLFINAIEAGHLPIIEYLDRKGADMTANNNLAVRLAAKRGRLDIVKFLHKNGTDITANNNEALSFAAREGHLSVIKYLYENGADITENDNRALCWAARGGYLDVVDYLLYRGADKDALDEFPDIKELIEQLFMVRENHQIAHQQWQENQGDLLEIFIKPSNQNQPHHSLLIAAHAGQFNITVTKQNIKPSYQDLTKAGKDGESILDILMANNNVDQLMVADLWIGRKKELGSILKMMPKKTLKNLDVSSLIGEINRKSLIKNSRKR